jgi:hypothetical protein
VLGPDVTSFRLTAPPASRRRFYRVLAQALVGCPPPAGVLVETDGSGRGPCLWLRPSWLATAVLRAVKLDPDVGEPTLVVPPARFARRVRYGLLTPRWTDRAEPTPGEPSVGLLPMTDGEPIEPGALRVQTLWRRTERSGILVATRFRASGVDMAHATRRYQLLGARLCAGWVRRTGRLAGITPARIGASRDWSRGRIRTIPAEDWWPMEPLDADATVEVDAVACPEPTRPRSGPTVVFGASGAGKTTYLAARAAEAVGRGRPVVVIDLHGDLAPAVAALSPPDTRERLVAVDAGERPVVGVPALAALPGEVDRAAAHFVAAVKRLSPDGLELAWGFRLERIFDTFARVVLETGGSLVDLYRLLTDPDRRDVARLATTRPEVAGFLDELAPIVRRDPEFLWSAAARLTKVVLVPELRELLAPASGGVAPDATVRGGRSLLIRVPLSVVGPEAAAFAGTVLLSRVYLGLVARAGGPGPVLLLLDEVQYFSPRLVAEILAEGRKFGVELLVATQFPDRLAPEVRAAAAGAAASVVAFRVPPASAASVGAWVALGAAAAGRELPTLPVGAGVAFAPEEGEPRAFASARPSGADATAWPSATARTRSEFPVDAETTAELPAADAEERLLLAVFAAEAVGRAVAGSDLVAAARSLPGAEIPEDRLELAARGLRRIGAFREEEGRLALSAAGERALGLGRPTGAVRESGEHRALLLRAFAVLARRGYALEVVRQGRFDTTLPDARLRQLGAPARSVAPVELAASIDRARSGWAWRYFHGRDVHVEAEVSGALRAERVMRGVAKARSRGAFVLFVVPDAERARRVRATLTRAGVPRDRATVWTLRPKP